ncbi:cysteine desulfurase-like protein [Agrobacterium rosae]|uniref:Cysteine desulfurase-like protein n=1 Tax=Agrobacterium rosae TaxID=1972867 RepID=A0AAE5RZB1_9HYPH|nr:cysteine desulfurase-like protein [Agrobacterium rosae]KAA3509488.1 cysteine desulfurase-like protein [Agrobacterium rosae]KAA3516388.1 cysteine desulfurase-like protein [Agrobacterium rosae]MCM2434894.1 cysteine desulfurase-like protein [Agrobacterium rosae]MDX8330886.1 cysteine desulfurase-like protein [Agrobacterium rosae]MQB50176.1 cysteine desulfurase-like protein [Agrobacterium rosae]
MTTPSPLDLDYVRSQFPGLSRGWTFFDNAGGSQTLKGALERINTFLIEKNVQIGGSYAVSQSAANALYEARTAAMHLVNASRPEEIIFGSSTTALLQNLARAMQSQLSAGDEIIVTVSDHESNIGPWDRLQDAGITLKFWPLNKETLTLDLADLALLMSERTKMVCVTHVSNILGSINPVREIADFVHARGAKICVDAVAYAPHRAVDVQAFDVDYYVFSLYKTYGPHYALMYGKYDLLLELDTLYHYFYGKDKVPGKLEPGNPNYELAYSTCGIVDYLTTLGEQAGVTGTVRQKIEAAFAAITAQENLLTERLLSYLRSRNDCRIVGQTSNHDETRVPTIAFRFDGREAGDLCKAMDGEQIAMRFGDFHSRRLAEYLELTDHGGMLRVSMVHYNTLEEVDRFTAALERILAGDAGFARAS